MYNEWSLDALYKGADDPALSADMKKLEDTIGEYKLAVAELGKADVLSDLRRIIDIKEALTLLVRRIAGF